MILLRHDPAINGSDGNETPFVFLQPGSGNNWNLRKKFYLFPGFVQEFSMAEIKSSHQDVAH
jgi:hypothetical protein